MSGIGSNSKIAVYLTEDQIRLLQVHAKNNILVGLASLNQLKDMSRAEAVVELIEKMKALRVTLNEVLPEIEDNEWYTHTSKSKEPTKPEGGT